MTRIIQDRTLFDGLAILAIVINDLFFLASLLSREFDMVFAIPDQVLFVTDAIAGRFDSMQLSSFNYVVAAMLLWSLSPYILIVITSTLQEGSTTFRIMIATLRIIAMVYFEFAE
eukprot:jgi/Hompol1/274/HPOL_002467-RA